MRSLAMSFDRPSFSLLLVSLLLQSLLARALMRHASKDAQYNWLGYDLFVASRTLKPN
jgi:hypothetical protein